MAPIPDERETNPSDQDPGRDEGSEELESPEHIIPHQIESSDDDDSETEGPESAGYQLLPQCPDDDDEDKEEDGSGDFESLETQLASSIPSVDELNLPPEPMTEVRGAGVDVSQAVAAGSVHPAFAAQYADNKIPVHLQVVKLIFLQLSYTFLAGITNTSALSC